MEKWNGGHGEVRSYEYIDLNSYLMLGEIKMKTI